MRDFVNRALPMMVAMMMLAVIAMPTNMTWAADLNVNTTLPIEYTSIQDPNIVVGYIDGTASDYHESTNVYGMQNERGTRTKIYFVFGSHMVWAYSFDGMNWISFTNNINEKYDTLFAEDVLWSAEEGTQDSASPKCEVCENFWAPNVIWNPDMGKWCMYVCVNGDYRHASVVLLTSDSLNGGWERVGSVVYSGFTNAQEAGQTDYFKVTGIDGNNIEWSDRYTAASSNGANLVCGRNVIHPCVFYEEGNLWMAYSSWFEGIYMLKLDAATGLRDYSTSYTLLDNTSDPYMGYKLAEGQNVSGEAPYIEKIGEYYYLFLNYGGMEAADGSNMRVFRSESVTGPYRDESGDDARYMVGTNCDDHKVGMRLISGDKWGYADGESIAKKYNTQFMDEDGKLYVICQTKTDGVTGMPSVRVRQIFVTESGWLAAAPFGYAGESLRKDINAEEVQGTYEVRFHESADLSKSAGTRSGTYSFTADGSVKSSGQPVGTWAWSTGKSSPYVNITIGETAYEGMFLEQCMETESVLGTWMEEASPMGDKTIVFTLVGDTLSEAVVWGYRLVGTDIRTAQDAAESLDASDETILSDETMLSNQTILSDETMLSNQMILNDETISSDQTILNDSGAVNDQLNEDRKVDKKMPSKELLLHGRKRWVRMATSNKQNITLARRRQYWNHKNRAGFQLASSG